MKNICFAAMGLLVFGINVQAVSAFSPVESVIVSGAGFTNRLEKNESIWRQGDISVSISEDGTVSVRSPEKCLSSVCLSWQKEWKDGTLFLPDAWSWGGGCLGWRPLPDGEIDAPWYFMVTADGVTDGFGVETGSNSLACWRIRKGGLLLVLDISGGGRPVKLGERTLAATKIVLYNGRRGERAFESGRAFCRKMCPRPRLPRQPVYGYNDWYCAYGKNTATNFLADAAYVSACAKGLENRPYVLMDDGWQKNSPPQMKAVHGVDDSGMGPWDESGPHFGMDMKTFCGKIAALGANPGVWYRPFRAWPESPAEWRLKGDARYFDPTVPEVRCHIVRDLSRFREWGCKIVKIDYLTFDIVGMDIVRQCDYDLAKVLGKDGFAYTSWRDNSRTTCEVVKELYCAMREAAGDGMIIIGCNALNHLAAGVFEVQRIGDDTSGNSWERTKKMGVNALAFRAVQNGTFFLADADCVGLAGQGAVPWEKNRQWLELLARSGTPLFVSWKRSLADEETRSMFAAMFRVASEPRATGEPLDWFDVRQPRHWRFDDGDREFDW